MNFPTAWMQCLQDISSTEMPFCKKYRRHFGTYS